MPLAWSEDGLPIGLQFVGRFGAEEARFSLAAEPERTQPWRDRNQPGQPSHEEDQPHDPRRIIVGQ